MTLHGTRESRAIARAFANLDDRIALVREAMAGESLSLGVIVAEWLERDGIAKDEHAAEVTASLLESPAMAKAARVLSETGTAPDSLHAAAVGLAAITSMTPAEWAAENYWHGHERKGL